MSPEEVLGIYQRDFPAMAKDAENIRAGRGREYPFWPDWCYLPVAIIAQAGADLTSQLDFDDQKRLLNGIYSAIAMFTWRITKGIYRFDPDLYRELLDTPFTGPLPTDAFLTLPEWCIYIETPGLVVHDHAIDGVFVMLDYDFADAYLCLLLNVADPDEPKRPLVTYVLQLERESPLQQIIAESVGQVQAESHATDNEMQVAARDALHLYRHVLPLLLYICAANADIAGARGERPQKPKPAKTKRGPKIFAPQQPRIWDVGVRVGAALRAYQPSQPQEPQGGTHKSPRPHVRRAHWHGYWTGPRSGERQFVLRWLHPILVGGSDTVPTIHNVKKL